MSDAQMFEDEAAIGEFKALMSDPANRAAFVELKAKAAETGVRTRYEHVLRAVSETPWAIRLPMLGVIVDLLAYRVAGGRLSAEEIEARVGAARRPSPSPQGVAVLPLHGVIMPKASMMTEMSGGTSVERFRAEFRQAMAAPDVSGIVIDVDSPGGMVDGVPEMAAEIRQARGTKPIVAIANTEAASAAYWLASQADQLVVTKSGRVGSIGVYTSHEDESVKSEQQGVKTTLISAGRFKTEGNPFEPLTDEARASLQGMVDDYYGMFVGDVSKGRRVAIDTVRSGFGEGRVVQARPALADGMVDRVATLDEVVNDMLMGIQTNRSTAAEVPAFDFVVAVEPPQVVAAVDNSAWDGNQAMGQCASAADYRSICAGEHGAGTPDERQHWALPHHYLGKGPNADGVRQAESRLPQTQDLTNREAAQGHLDAHMREINPDGAVSPDAELLASLELAKVTNS